MIKLILLHGVGALLAVSGVVSSTDASGTMLIGPGAILLMLGVVISTLAITGISIVAYSED